MREKPRRTGTKTGRPADRSPVLPLRAADATPLDPFCCASPTTQGGGGNAGRSREDFSHDSTRKSAPLYSRMAELLQQTRAFFSIDLGQLEICGEFASRLSSFLHFSTEIEREMYTTWI